MLKNTFIHLPGVGPQRERAFWDQGILDWDGFLTTAQAGRLRGRNQQSAVELVRHSLDALACGNAGFFKPHLPAGEAWRLYSEFADRALFLDIETTGLSGEYDELTVIGALGNGELALFIKGINLEQFPAYIAQFSAPGQLQWQSVRRALLAGPLSPGPARSISHRSAVRAGLAGLQGRAQGRGEPVRAGSRPGNSGGGRL